MASFEKKLGGFLDAATEHRIIEKPVANNLTAFINSGEYEHKGWFSLSTAMGGLGAIALCFGIILIIATNWYMFSDLAKISAFLILMGGSHFAGIYAKNTGYEKLSIGLHLLGAGLFIAGIGLIAQIFNLYSRSGESFLIWSIAIAPLAILLRNGPIALLSVVAFTIWGNIYIGYIYARPITWTGITFDLSICLSMVMGGRLLKQRGSNIGTFLQIPGMIGVIGFMYGFGFMHNSRSLENIYLLIPSLTLIPAVLMGVYLWIKNFGNSKERYFLIAMGFAVLTVILIMFTCVIGVNEHAYMERSSFGGTKKIYLMPLIISISAWAAYFGLAFWGVIYGALNHQRWMLNGGVVLIGIGIFTRFIDLMGSMRDTGTMFIICGLLLFAIGFVLEKWRRKLIRQASI